jgi:aminoglycoside phosphotransferase (APT) family kinase protein
MLTRDESRRIVAAMASLHDAYVGTRIDGLCPLVDRNAFFTPAAVRSVATHPMAPFALPGWERLVELAPEDIAPTLLRLLDRPGMLAAALSGYPSTLVHGDLKIANLGFDDRRIVMLDWGSLTGYAPRAVDYAWYLAINGAAIDASLDEQLSDVLAVLTPEDQHALPLALLGVLLQLGWDKGLAATSEDLAVRERELADLRWWWARVREALEQWSPR